MGQGRCRQVKTCGKCWRSHWRVWNLKQTPEEKPLLESCSSQSLLTVCTAVCTAKTLTQVMWRKGGISQFLREWPVCFFQHFWWVTDCFQPSCFKDVNSPCTTKWRFTCLNYKKLNATANYWPLTASHILSLVLAGVLSVWTSWGDLPPRQRCRYCCLCSIRVSRRRAVFLVREQKTTPALE